MHVFQAFLLVCALLVAAVPSSAQFGACSANSVNCPCCISPTTPTYSSSCSEVHHNPHWSLRYDLIAGTLDAHARWSGVADMVANDDYVVVGLPDGTPIAFTLEARVFGSASPITFLGGGSGIATLRVEAQEATFQFNSSDSVDTSVFWDTLRVQVSTRAGEVYRAAYALRVGSGYFGAADATMAFVFTGLPPGARREVLSGVSAGRADRGSTLHLGGLEAAPSEVDLGPRQLQQASIG